MRRKVVATLAVSVLLTVGVAEVAVRVAEPILPDPIEWNSAEAQVRIDQLDRYGDTIDTLFVGTSMVMQGVDPTVINQVTHRHAYNAGQPAQVPTAVEIWVDELLERTSPDVVVWGMSSLAFNQNRTGSDATEALRDALALKDGFLGDLDRWMAQRSALVRQRENLRQPRDVLEAMAGQGASGDLARVIKETSELGQRTRHTPAVNPTERARVADVLLVDWAWSEEQADAVVRVADRLAEEGIALVFVLMPVPDRYIELHPHGVADFTEAMDKIEALGERLDVPVIDGVTGLTDNDLFVDYTHLSESGAIEFSGVVAEELVDLGY